MGSGFDILVLGGDGIGPEVCGVACKVLERVQAKFGLTFNFEEALVGGIAYDREGAPITDATLDKAKTADAVLLGAVGGPKWEPLPFHVRPERGLLALREELGLFANLRPAIVHPALVDASSLKREVVEGVDLMVVRELTGGIYFGRPRGDFHDEEHNEPASRNTLVYRKSEVERVARVAFEIARKREKRLMSVDKANVLESTEFWRNIVTEMQQKEYTDIELSHMYVDNCAMQLVRWPKQFDVIVTNNMFGDILSDAASMITGSLGMLPSASLGAAGKGGLYEPVHGSAPDISGQNKANPMAMVLSAGMMLRYGLEQPEAADAVEGAVTAVLERGLRTPDIAALTPGATVLGTVEMGQAIIEAMG